MSISYGIPENACQKSWQVFSRSIWNQKWKTNVPSIFSWYAYHSCTGLCKIMSICMYMSKWQTLIAQNYCTQCLASVKQPQFPTVEKLGDLRSSFGERLWTKIERHLEAHFKWRVYPYYIVLSDIISTLSFFWAPKIEKTSIVLDLFIVESLIGASNSLKSSSLTLKGWHFSSISGQLS